jgi:hypothetical protein
MLKSQMDLQPLRLRLVSLVRYIRLTMAAVSGTGIRALSWPSLQRCGTLAARQLAAATATRVSSEAAHSC